jgi:Rrf2 family protein
MNLTSKSRYALKIMIDLAYHGASQALVRRNEIAHRQGVPTDYLDQIMIKLRRAGLVKSFRGRTGGYLVGRAPTEITMWDIFSAVEGGGMMPVDCIMTNHTCDFESSCSSKTAWSTIFGSVKESLSQIQLSRLVTDWRAEHESMPEAISGDIGKVQECRSGSSNGCSIPSSKMKAPLSEVSIDG